MKTLLAIIGSLLLLGVAVFCVFGFLATFEPTNNITRFLIFRTGYAVVGVGSLVGIGFLISKALPK